MSGFCSQYDSVSLGLICHPTMRIFHAVRCGPVRNVVVWYQTTCSIYGNSHSDDSFVRSTRFKLVLISFLPAALTDDIYADQSPFPIILSWWLSRGISCSSLKILILLYPCYACNHPPKDFCIGLSVAPWSGHKFMAMYSGVISVVP